MSVVDPIEAISGVKRKTQVNPATPSSSHLGKQSDFLYNTNYVIAVMQLTQVCMKHQQELVSIRSKLAEITTKIQADLNVLNQTFSTFENNAGPNPSGYATDPNFFNGFVTSLWDKSTSTASQALQSATTNQLNAFFDLFYCSKSASSDVTVNDLMTMDNPVDPTKSFDMQKFWMNLSEGFNTNTPSQSGVPGKNYSDGYFNMIETNGTSTTNSHRPSLIQQYIYYQAKLNLYQATPEDINAAGSDFSKVPGMNFDPREQDFDPNLANILAVIDSTTAVLSPQANVAGEGSYLCWLRNAQRHQKDETKTPLVTLYNQDATLAYNYFWTKDPQAKALDGVDSDLDKQFHASHGTDNLSDMYTKTSSAQAALSSASSAQGTNFQQDTSGMTTENNEVQQIISSFMQGQGAVVGNFKGA